MIRLRHGLVPLVLLLTAVASPASALPTSDGLPTLELPRLRPLAAPAAASSASSATSAPICFGLANYEIVRAGAETATCSEGNKVLGGSCTGLGNGAPDGDGSAWVCDAGELAIAICASICSEAPAQTGACCVEFECMDGLTAADCEAEGGEYLGDGSECGPTSCEPFGACCIEDDPLCVEVGESECANRDGVFLGNGVTCDSDEAAECFEEPAPTGACCTTDINGRPVCNDGITEEECLDDGGNYQGDDTDCGSVMCR